MGGLKTAGIVIAITVIGLCVIESSPGQNQPDNSKSAKSAKERAKMDFWRQRKIKHSRDSALKAHMKHQTREVRRRMKKDARKAKKFNND
jgi:hypothetical protein